MKYLVIARRFRPQLFREVVGQEAILTTLKNALRLRQTAHAYLFCGSRGVGKTTLARLFAKALNCQALGNDFEPCDQCASCIEIKSGQSLDVIEIDGASNRGIDDIRQINETVGYAPSHGKFKIYIIDEVHMLTKEAFNALLKTLEEPPDAAKFFFATTEPHKVPATILSRCQRYDLQRLTDAQICQKLASIAVELQRSVSPEAIHLIATFADGSLRDAESLLDQILCFAEGNVTADHVRHALGLLPDEMLFELDRAFSEGRVAFAFEFVDRLFQMGKDLGHFAEQWIQHMRRITVTKTLGVEALHLPESLAASVAASARLYTQPQCFFILDLLLNAYAALQKSPFQRASLESLLLQMLRSKNRIPIEVLVRRLSELEQKWQTEPAQKETPLSVPLEVKQVLTPQKETPPPIPLEEKPALQKETPPPPKAEAPPPVQEESHPIALKPVPLPQMETPPPIQEEIRPVELKPAPPPQMETPPPKAEAPLPIREEVRPLALKPVPFNPYQPQPLPAEPVKPLEVKTPEPVSTKHPSHYETLLRFAAVELEGTIRN